MSRMDPSRPSDAPRDRIVASVSHELRTPLTSLLAWTQLLRSGRIPEHQQAYALERIEHNALTLSRSIEVLLGGLLVPDEKNG
jgi:signal transduction histidine kinase